MAWLLLLLLLLLAQALPRGRRDIVIEKEARIAEEDWKTKAAETKWNRAPLVLF